MNLLFVCLGNICRSPMAEGVMLRLLEKENPDFLIRIDSAGTYGGHVGELPDARMRAAASKRGYTLTHKSRKFKVSDFEEFDLIVVMDDSNYHDVKDMAYNLECEQKIVRMSDYCQTHQVTYIPDPYYEGARGFEYVIDLLEDACGGLLAQILKRD